MKPSISSSGEAKSASAASGPNKTTPTKKPQQPPPQKMVKKKAPPPPPVMFRLHSPQMAFGTEPPAIATESPAAAAAAKKDAKKEAEAQAENHVVVPPPADATSSSAEQQADKDEAKSNGSKKARKPKKTTSHVLIAEKGGEDDLPAAASASVAEPPATEKTTIAPTNEPSSNPTPISDVNNDAVVEPLESSLKRKKLSPSKEQSKSRAYSIIPSGMFDDSDSEEETGNQGRDTTKKRTKDPSDTLPQDVLLPNTRTKKVVVPSKDSNQNPSSSSRRQSRSKSTTKDGNPPSKKVKVEEKAVSSAPKGGPPPKDGEAKKTPSRIKRRSHIIMPVAATKSLVMAKSPQKKTRSDASTEAKELTSSTMEGREQDEKEVPSAVAKVCQKITKRKRGEEEEEEEEDSTSKIMKENDEMNEDDTSSSATITTTRRSERSNMFRGLLSDASMDHQAVAHAIIIPKVTSSDLSSTPTTNTASTSKSTKRKRPPQPSLSNPPPAPALSKSETKANAKKKKQKGPNTNKHIKILSWEEKIALLQAHKDKYKSCDLKRAPKEEVLPSLLGFVNESRKQYKRLMRKQHSTMTKERIDALEKMGFDFCPMESGLSQRNRQTKTQQQWDANFAELEKYKAKHGDCLVSCLAEETLGNFVRRQRKLYNRIGRDGFPPERLARLEAIGFDFDPVRSGASMAKKRVKMFPRVNANWEKHYNGLKKFKEIHGHLVIGPNTKGWAGLYSWVHVQRKEYKKFMAGEDALMHEQWITKMNKLAFNWAPMVSENYSTSVMRRHSEYYNDIWNRHYQVLLRYLKKNKHFPTKKGDRKLQNWLNYQRQHKRKNENGLATPLTNERIKLLDDVGFDWGGNQAVGKSVDDEKKSSTFAPDVAKAPDVEDENQADTSEMLQDCGMSDSVVELGGEDGLAAAAEMVLDASESDVTDLLHADRRAIATETVQV